MSTTLPLFWHISSTNKKERIDASVKLIGALEQFQAQYVSRQQSPGVQTYSEDEDEEEEGPTKQGDGLDVLNAQDVSYSIRRLIRGLASPRESSRLGFAVALTELLSRINTITCSQIVTVITDSSKPQGSMSGQEERDVLFARLFGLTAVIQSGLLVKHGSLPESASSSAEVSTLSSYTVLISELIALGEKKSWLRESSWHSILLAIDTLQDSDVAWKEEAVEATIQQLFVEYKIWSPEKIAATLKLQLLYPNKDWNKFLIPTFKSGDLLSSTNLQTVARILKESGVEDTEKETGKSSASSWKPQLHFVWDYLLDQFLPGPNSGSAPKGSFQDFFRIAVDESLFSATASPQRKYWGFQVFQKALSRIDEEHMPMLFTKNFMRSWINHLSNKDRYLHKIAQQTATEVQAFVEKHPQMGFSLILQLTGVHGSQQFDKLTKTKTVESILASTDAAGIQKYIQWLFSQIDDPEATDNDALRAIGTRRQWVIDQMGALIRNGGIPKDDEWVQSILDWLVVHGLFVVKKKSSKNAIVAARSLPKPTFSDELRKSCRTRLLSSLSDLNTHTTAVKIGNKTTIKASAVASDGEFWVSKVLKTISQLEDDKHVTLLAELDEEDQELRAKARELVQKLKSVSGDEDREEAARGAQLLLLATTLQHYCTEEEEADNDSLQACIDAATHMFPEPKKKKESKKTIAKVITEEEEDTPEPVDVLVDTIIGFLEKSTAYLRTTGNQVFALLAGSVKESTVDLILTQLERRDPTAEDEDEDMDMEGEGSEDEDVEEDESSEEDNEEDEEEEEEDIDDEEAQALRTKIEEALRVNGIEPATEEDSEDEDLMDDDQMMAIDEQLAQAFRSQHNEKKSGKVDAQREATHFKNRVLDLVEIFIKKQPSNPLVLRFILPLVDLITNTGLDERQLSDKARGVLRSRIAKLKEIPSDLNQEAVVDAFEGIHKHARRANSLDLLATLSQCSVYVTRILLHLEAEQIVIDTYRGSLTDFFTRKNSALNANFFLEFVRRYPVVAWKLRDDVVDLSNKAINGYRQAQAFALMETLLTQISSINDQKDELISFVPSLAERLQKVAKASCEEAATLSAAQLKELMKLVLLALRQTGKLAPERLSELWKLEPWTSLKNDFASCSRLKSSMNLQKMCEQVASTLQKSSQSPVKGKKRKATEPEPVVETKKTKRKKVKGE